MNPLVRLCLRNLLRSRMRSVVTLVAIVFGVCGLILSGGFVNDIFIQLGEALIHSQSGHAQVGHAAVFGEDSRSPEKHLLASAEQLRRDLLKEPEVRDVLARITFSGVLNNGKTDYAVVGDGVDPDREIALGTRLRLVSGRMLTEQDRFGAMLGDGVAQALQLGPGDRATLVVSTINGAMNTLDIEIVGVFQTFSKDFDARAVRISLADTQELLATRGASKLVVVLHRTDQTDAFVTRMRDKLRAQGLTVVDWRQLNDFYEKTVALYRQQFGFLKAMVLLMVCISVVNTVNMSLFERIWEFGTMRALGNRNNAVSALIFAETTTLGMIGATLGVMTGIALALLVSGFGIPMPPPPNADIGYVAYIRLVPTIIAESWVIGLGATVVAAVFPAWRISRLSIVDALRARE